MPGMTENDQTLPRLLSNYADIWITTPNLYQGHSLKYEQEMLDRFLQFYSPNPELFCRSHLSGHFTGSALVTNKTFDRVLLTHHTKLNRWLHLGGHADGDPLIANVALREAQEESGLLDFEFVDLEEIFNKPKINSIRKGPIPYDLDCHYIPEQNNVPGHNHYDVIFLLTTDDKKELQITSESIDLRWFSLEEAKKIALDTCLVRLFQKLTATKKP